MNVYDTKLYQDKQVNLWLFEWTIPLTQPVMALSTILSHIIDIDILYLKLNICLIKKEFYD